MNTNYYEPPSFKPHGLVYDCMIITDDFALAPKNWNWLYIYTHMHARIDTHEYMHIHRINQLPICVRVFVLIINY